MDTREDYWTNFELGMDLYQKDRIFALLTGLHLLESNKIKTSRVFKSTIFGFCAGIDRHIGLNDIKSNIELAKLIEKFLFEYEKYL